MIDRADADPAVEESETRPPSPPGRRALAYAVLGCLLGAGLAVFAATRTWTVEEIARPVPLPATRTVRTGADLLPWLPALALVGLAGAGAVLGTRGIGRRLVGGLLTVLGVGLITGAAYGVGGTDQTQVQLAWPLLGGLGGLLTAVAGAVTAMRGAGWPVMGARYEPTRRDEPVPDDGGRLDGRRTRVAWDALDRGEDPTVG